MTLTINIDEENLVKARRLAKGEGDTVEHVIENFLKKMLDDSYLNAFPTSKERQENPEKSHAIAAIGEILKNPDFTDFEDVVQDELARFSGADFLLTRNILDFRHCKLLQVCSVETYLNDHFYGVR